ncbi:MAG: DUF927 domain-containing protein [Verrucomicrobia bacterium]|nr:DUF927 domain-containing protein [Verrucomicrobiota bacterium]
MVTRADSSKQDIIQEAPQAKDGTRKVKGSPYALTSYDLKTECLNHMKNAGYPFEGPLVTDGAIHRYSRDNNKDEPDEWYAAWERTTENGYPFLNCAFGTWQGGYTKEIYNSYSKDHKLSASEKKACADLWINQQKELQKQLKEEEDKRKKWALEGWEKAKSSPSDPKHTAYLERKKCSKDGIRYGFAKFGEDSAPTITIDLRNTNGELQAIQRIREDGKKKITGLKSGNFHLRGEIKENTHIYIGEGLATVDSGVQGAKTLGIDCAGVVAIDCGNLMSVTANIRAKYPNHTITILYDDDKETTTTDCTNPGKTKAEKAANKYGCNLIGPVFPRGEDHDSVTSELLTDFNDLHVHFGIEVVALQLKEALSKPKDKTIPWANAKTPPGYEISQKGVYLLKPQQEKKQANNEERFSENAEQQEPAKIRICGPAWVEGRSRDFAGGNNGLIIRWIDLDKNLREATIEKSKLHAKGNDVAMQLASDGLPIEVGEETRLRKYFNDFTPEKTFRAVKTLGWLETTTGELIYVTATSTFQKAGAVKQDEIIFQPDGIFSSKTHSQQAQGTLEQWKTHIAKQCEGNDLAIFSLLTSLSAPLIKYSGSGSYGVHIGGETSKGKTTLKQIAASIWGCGVDPTVAPGLSIIKKWNTTANALEVSASQRNDNVLFLDEIGTCPGKDLQKVIYDLFGGKGKDRLDKNSNAKTQREWRVVVLSSGERTLKERLSDTNSQAPAGLFVRFIDLAIEEVFKNYHNKQPKTFVDDLKGACGTYFGTAGTAFIQNLAESFKNAQDLQGATKEGINATAAKIGAGLELNQEQGRVLHIFSLIAFAGTLAAKWGIIPFSATEIIQSVRNIFLHWLSGNRTLPEEDRIVMAVKDFIIRKRDSVFKPRDTLPDEIRKSTDTLGYIDDSEGWYLLTSTGMKEATIGFKKAAEALYKKGYLIRRDKPSKEGKQHNASSISVPGLGAKTRLYIIKKEIVEFDSGDE